MSESESAKRLPGAAIKQAGWGYTDNIWQIFSSVYYSQSGIYFHEPPFLFNEISLKG